MFRKSLLAFGFLLLGLAGQAAAGFNLPQHVYSASRLDQACEAAAKQKKAITILYSDRDTTCSLCTGASNDIIYSLDQHSIIVYVNGKTDLERLPPMILSALASPQAGKFIPKTIIASPQMDQLIYILPYQRQNRIVLINEAKERIDGYFNYK